MATKTTKIIAGLAFVVILASLVYAGISDLVYTTGRQQVSQLVAQSSEGQRILDAYYMIQSPQAFAENFMASKLCEQAGELCGKYNEIRGIIGQVSSSTSYFEDPSGFATSLLQQQACQQAPEACNAYTMGMGYYGQIEGTSKDMWGTAESYAMTQVMQNLDSEIGTQVAMVYSMRGYMDTLQMEEGSSFAGSSEESGESEGEETESEDLSAGSITGRAVTELTDILPANRKRGRCIIGFNLDGTFGNIYNCMTQQVTDVSRLAGLPPGTLITSPECFITKKSGKFSIKTKDSGDIDEPAKCAIKMGPIVYKNLAAGKIKKGPEGKSINSGTFIFGKDGKLERAEFMVAKEETEYVFGEKKYKLPKGATVLYKEGEVKLGFDYTEEQFELFSFGRGVWVSDGIVVPDAVGSVDIQPAPSNADYAFRISGNFRMATASERLIVAKGTVFYRDNGMIRVGENSDVAFMSREGGARVYTADNEIALTRCSDKREGSIDFCDGNIYASGSGFSFTEVRGLMVGDASSIAADYGLSSGYFCSFNSVECSESEGRQMMLPGESFLVENGAVSVSGNDVSVSGSAGALLSGMLSMQGSLVMPVEKNIKMLRIADAAKISDYIKERGHLNSQADIASVGIAPAVPDILKNAVVPSSFRDVKFNFKDTGIKAETKDGRTCIGLNTGCTLSVRQPSSAPKVWIQWRGIMQDELYVNNERVMPSAVNIQDDVIMVSLQGRNLLFIDSSGTVELQTKEWDIVSKMFKKANVGKLTRNEVEKIKGMVKE